MRISTGHLVDFWIAMAEELTIDNLVNSPKVKMMQAIVESLVQEHGITEQNAVKFVGAMTFNLDHIDLSEDEVKAIGAAQALMLANTQLALKKAFGFHEEMFMEMVRKMNVDMSIFEPE